MSSPEISVIVPVHNARDYVREAVQSLLAENLPSLEVVVIDDGSTDGSAEQLAGLPIQLVRFSECRGVAAARNEGLKRSAGAIVTFLDADDRLAPGGLRWRVDYLKQHRQVFAVAGFPAAIIDERGKEIPHLSHLLTPGYVCPEKIDLAYFKAGGIFPVLLWLYAFRRELITQTGLFDETLKVAEDCDYLFRMLEKVTIPVVPKPTVDRRWHAKNLSLITKDQTQRELTNDTKAAVTQIARRYGMEVGTDFHLWENGFQPTRKA